MKEEARILYTFSQIQIVYIWPFALCLLRLGTLLYALYGKHSSVLCAQAENFAVPDLSAKICFHALFYSLFQQMHLCSTYIGRVFPVYGFFRELFLCSF